MGDPFLDAARAVIALAVNDLHSSIEGLPPEALSWRPVGDETNSIAVMATHSMLSARSWLSIAVGAPPPDRDRDSEFIPRDTDTAALLAQVDALRRECDAILALAKDVDWTAMRATHSRPEGRPNEAPAAWSLLHALEHLKEHVGHIGLTRQLWEQRASG